MCLWVSYRKKYEKNIFFASLKSLKKGVRSGVGSPDPDRLVRGSDPGIRIRIRTKMSQIPNTAKLFCKNTLRTAGGGGGGL
jgi:hypothetical protein